jgi:ferredoxin
MGIEIVVDPVTCMGSGNCLFWAPATFDLGDDGIAFVIDPSGDPVEKIVLAVQGCPTRAITATRDGAALG